MTDRVPLPFDDGSMTDSPNYYQVLGLPQALQDKAQIPAQTLRSAYRRALLQNHPDKSQSAKLAKTFSMDQISEAFTTLSDSKLRREYDEGFKKQGAAKPDGQAGQQPFRTGVEVVDLDDLSMSEEEGVWYRSCRCGDSRGFLIRETDLEEAAGDGELNVGCAGCSLWMKVLFDVIEDGLNNTEEERKA